MSNLSVDVFSILWQLMPGFLAAWVLYGFTAYAKPSQFERVVQALIFSFIIKAVLPLERLLFLELGQTVHWGAWDQDAEILASSITAIVFGLVLSYFANNDKLYKLARKFKLTKRTAYPSEWFGMFAENVTYTVLHLKGERRIYGWPTQWPSEPTSGHFVLVSASWLLDEEVDDKSEILLDSNDSIMIAAKDVEMVEFVKQNKGVINNGSESSKSEAS